MAYGGRDLEGVRGWLLFFVLTLGAFTPLSLLLALVGFYASPISSRFSDQSIWSTYRTAETVLIAVHFAACCFLTWRMLRIRTWSTVVITIGGLWLMGLGVVLADLLITLGIAGGSPSRIFGAQLPGTARSLVYCAIWTAYLLKSERVANTYHRYDSSDELEAVFS